MQSLLITKEKLRSVLSDIQHVLIQHKHTAESLSEDKTDSRLNRQHQDKLKQKLHPLHSADVAHILESLPPDQRKKVWSLIPNNQQGDILIALSAPVRETVIDEMAVKEMIVAAEGLLSEEISDLAFLAQSLPDQVVEEILNSLGAEQRQQLEDALSYPAGSVGSLMDFSVISIRENARVEDVLAYCRKNGDLPDQSQHLFVIDSENKLIGMLSLQKLITLPFDQKVSSIMSRSMATFLVSDSADQAALAFKRYDLAAAPVIDDEGRLIGRICINEIMDYMREKSELELMQSIGFMDPEDKFSGIWSGAKNRWLWVVINLIAAFVATRVISMFEDKIAELVILATLLPIVSATAGSVGNQACTLVVRSLAMGQITVNNIKYFYTKEVLISLVNGLICGGLISLVVGYFYAPLLGVLMGFALAVNFAATAFIGVSVPIIRNKLNLDPALGAHVLVTFFADAFGFFIFLGMAVLFL